MKKITATQARTMTTKDKTVCRVWFDPDGTVAYGVVHAKRTDSSKSTICGDYEYHSCTWIDCQGFGHDGNDCYACRALVNGEATT